MNDSSYDEVTKAYWEGRDTGRHICLINLGAALFWGWVAGMATAAALVWFFAKKF